MSRFTRQEEQPGRYNGISGFMNRMEKRPITGTEDTMIYGVVSYLRYIVDIPIEEIRNVLDAPHETLPDVTIGKLVTTAINDLSNDNGALHVVVINNQEGPFIQAGIIYNDDHPSSMPLVVSLMLNSASPEAYGWNNGSGSYHKISTGNNKCVCNSRIYTTG